MPRQPVATPFQSMEGVGWCAMWCVRRGKRQEAGSDSVVGRPIFALGMREAVAILPSRRWVNHELSGSVAESAWSKSDHS